MSSEPIASVRFSQHGDSTLLQSQRETQGGEGEECLAVRKKNGDLQKSNFTLHAL